MKATSGCLRRAGIAGVAFLCATLIGVTPARGQTAGSGSGTANAGVEPPSGDETLPSTDRRDERAPAEAFEHLQRAAGERGRVRAVVGLQAAFTPEGSLSEEEVRNQRSAIAEERRGVVAALAGNPDRVVQEFDTLPYVALELSPGAVRALERSGRAASVQEDVADEPTLAASTPLVEATEAHALARTGAGKVVAVLDTGIDKAHGFLQQSVGGSKVVSEACYSAGANCPGGVTNSTATGSGVPCTYAANGCTHGTHVAGIAAGRGPSSSGVARDARLVSVQVFSRFTGAGSCPGEDPCTKSYVSDQMKGLERVYALRGTFSIAAVNMSIGGGKHTTNCDNDARKAAVDNLRSVRIATVVASGNNGYSDGVSAPSCISTAVTVGSTTTSDVMSSFSNSSSLVELLAPGSAISSSMPGGGFGIKSGTSMATPHVAGAWAVMRQVDDLASVPTVLQRLQETGRPVTDADNGVTKARIRTLSASVRIRDTGFRNAGTFGLAGGDVASNGVGLATRAGGPASTNISIGALPAGSSVRAAYLYWSTIGGPDNTAVFKGVTRTGTLVGASRDTCWNRNQLGPNRVYRAAIPVSEVPGGESYSISGVGGVGGADGQGASLVLVYGNPSLSWKGLVYIQHGAMTVTGTETMSHTFSGLSVATSTLAAHLHAGIVDGNASASEDPLLFNGTAVTAANAYNASDGLLMDDDRIAVPQLPAGQRPAPRR